MASHAAALLAFSLLTLWTSPALGDANDAEDCCLSVAQRPIPGYLVRAYRYLLLKDGCRVPAVVFTTMRGHQLCSPPDQPWVGRIIRRLQRNSAKASLALPSPASSLQAPAQDPSP
ncbi:C-C motif chemokine 19 isoform X1 [Hippopotamus amphibius kiboko]|uniref:C-C motif chemokine 19 isoform X1 n=1 Tax=Hippopotamus amphibius kiboko TaxID=575201 RepID=UPI002594D3DD|nr:C-C motif chemokine 19 isoform X1 [Hippopotamus amphibius kiboko]